MPDLTTDVRYVKGIGEQRAKGLEKLGIRSSWLERYPMELSGGELQRICVARALGPKLRFLLCDEASAMLDVITQAQLWRFLLDQAERRSLGLLIVSHDAKLLGRLCTGMASAFS